MRTLLRRVVPRGVRNWLRSPARTIRWIWDEFRHAIGLNPSLVLRPGWRVRCHPTVFRIMRRSQIADPEQAAEFDEFIRACRDGMIGFDIGAHTGVFSLAALRHGGPEAKVVAVDASPAAVRMLRIQRSLNQVHDRMIVRNAAVVDRLGPVEMLDVGVLADGYYVASNADRDARDVSVVEGVTIDHLVVETGLRPTHIKIDVEGFEAAVFAGGGDTLGRSPRPTLFVELHHAIVRARGGDTNEALDRLAALGYRRFELMGRSVTRGELLAHPLVRIVVRD